MTKAKTKTEVEELSQELIWRTLRNQDCSDLEYKKMSLTYIAWADLWAKLMDTFPNSSYIFDEPTFFGEVGNQTCEVSCSVYVGQFERNCTLPVMTASMPMKSIVNPTSRDINDAKQRCFVKAMAMHGLGLYLWEKKSIKSKPSVSLDDEMPF